MAERGDGDDYITFQGRRQSAARREDFERTGVLFAGKSIMA
jgi:hypothetical protein